MRFLWLIPIAVIVGLDQFTKYLATANLKPSGTYPLIDGVFHFTYHENTGAAFGILKDHRWVFMVVSTVAIIAVLAFMFLMYKTYKDNLLYTGLAFVAGGGIGNMIDRTLLGYVVDFFDFRLINFAIFNVADAFVCIGFALIVIYLIRDTFLQKQ